MSGNTIRWLLTSVSSSIDLKVHSERKVLRSEFDEVINDNDDDHGNSASALQGLPVLKSGFNEVVRWLRHECLATERARKWTRQLIGPAR